MIYLAGPIDSATELNWRREFAEKAVPLGVAVYDPYAAYQGDPGILPVTGGLEWQNLAREIEHMNRHALKACDLMFANLDAGFPFGTIREIEIARRHDVDVVVYCKKDLSHHFNALDCSTHTNWHHAIRYALMCSGISEYTIENGPS